MRMLMKAMLDLETANQAIADGSITKTLDAVAQEIKPEAAYFLAEEGERTAYFFFDLKESSQIPLVVEELYQELGARITLTPAMNREELARGLDGWAKKATHR